MNSKKYNLPILVVLIWLCVIVSFYGYLQYQGLTLEKFIFQEYNYIKENLFLGTVVFIIIFTIRPLLFIPASPFHIFAGAVFGLMWGAAISIIASGISAMFSYAVGKATGGAIFEKLPEAGRLKKMKGKIEKNTFFTVLMIRIILPFDIMSYLCGVFKISFTSYTLASIVGSMLSVFTFVLAGTAFYGQNIYSFSEVSQNINYSYLYLASGLFLTSIIVSRILKKKYKW